MMRLLVVGNSRLEHVLRWVRYFVARGHEVHFISVWAAEIPGVTFHQVGCGSRGLVRRLGSYVKLGRRLGGLLAEIRPDIVHAHFGYTYGAAVAGTGFHPMILFTQGSDVLLPRWWERVVKPLARLALRHADMVVCNSVAQVLAAHELGASCPIHQLPFGVDVDRFAPAPSGRRGEGFRLGIFKALKPLYGHCDLLDAFAIVVAEHPEARLVIAGDGPLRRRLEGQARALGIERSVDFLGRVPHARVHQVMATLDAVALASYSEGLPNMIMEAFAMGLPAVATGVGGVPELVKQGKTGLLVPASDPWTLASAICQLIEEPAARRRMGQAARAMVESEHDCRKSLEEMEQVCLAMINGGGPAFRFRRAPRSAAGPVAKRH